MAKVVTTVYLEEHQKSALEQIASERGERTATILREAIEWYIGITPYLRGQLGELVNVYEELPPQAIIARLIAEDERRRNDRNTKENGIKAIKQDTEAINKTTLGTAHKLDMLYDLVAGDLSRFQTIEAARAAGCDDVEEFDEEGMMKDE